MRGGRAVVSTCMQSRRACLMREPIRAHQSPSEPIGAHQTPRRSNAIRGNRWQLVAIRVAIRVAISGDPRRSEAIRGTDGARVVASTFWFCGCAPAAAIKCNQAQSSVVASTFWFCGCAPAAAMSASIPPESAMDSAISSTRDRFRSAAVTCVRRQGGHQPQCSAISMHRFRRAAPSPASEPLHSGGALEKR